MIRKKIVHGKPRYYLYKNFRDKTAKYPKQKLLAYLGEHQTIELRWAYFSKQIRTWRKELQNRERRLNRDIQYAEHCKSHLPAESRRAQATLDRSRKDTARLGRQIDRAKKFLAFVRNL